MSVCPSVYKNAKNIDRQTDRQTNFYTMRTSYTSIIYYIN